MEMICLQPFTPIYKQDVCGNNKNRTSGTSKSAEILLSSSSDSEATIYNDSEMANTTTGNEMNTTDPNLTLTSTSAACIADALHKLYQNKYIVHEGVKQVETDCSYIKFATDTVDNKEVILKFIKDDKWGKHELAIMEYLNEKKVNNVIRLLDHFTDPETDKMVLVLPRLKPINLLGNDLITIQKLFYQLLNALHELHNFSVVHLDITFSNLMLDENDDLVIIDFGLARFMDGKPHPIGCGTSGFIAPEVYFGDCCDAKPDIYSAGIVFGMLLVPYINNCSLEDLGSRLARCTTTSLVQDKVRENYLFERYHYSQIPEIIFDAADLLVQCLEYDAESRITSLQAMRHPFLQKGPSDFVNTEYDTYNEKHPLKKTPSRTIIYYRS